MEGWNFDSGGLVGWWRPVGQRSRTLIEGLLVQVPGLTSQGVAKKEKVTTESANRGETRHFWLPDCRSQLLIIKESDQKLIVKTLTTSNDEIEAEFSSFLFFLLHLHFKRRPIASRWPVAAPTDDQLMESDGVERCRLYFLFRRTFFFFLVCLGFLKLYILHFYLLLWIAQSP